jgi:hypothetical protein
MKHMNINFLLYKLIKALVCGIIVTPHSEQTFDFLEVITFPKEHFIFSKPSPLF